MMANGTENTDGLDLDDEDRLPWLETADEYTVDEDDGGRKIAMALIALLLLAGVIGLVWWLTNSNSDGANGKGDLIAAQEGDYKVRPDDPQAKEFEGEGDASFAASEGKSQDAKLGKAEATEKAKRPGAAADGAAAAGDGANASGAMVQLGAFSQQAQADAAWNGFAQRFASIKALPKKVVKGQVDGATVYRLNAVAGSAQKARDVCNGLKAAGENCLVVN